MADLIRTFRLLNAEQRVAAVGAVLLGVSTFGPFSFVEAAQLLIVLGVLALLRARAQGKRFHLPFGDGTAIAGAGVWAAALIVVRLFDRPLGQNLLALACAAILILAGARERAKRPPDDLPEEHRTPPIRRRERPERRRRTPGAERPASRGGEPPASRGGEPTGSRGEERPGSRGGEPAPPAAEDETEPLPPPEFEPYKPAAGEQLRLGGDEPERQRPGDA
jgi:hypothetical protein